MTANAQGQVVIGFSSVRRGTPLVNGIEVDSGGSIVQAINCGELAGGTITVNPGTFTNQGTLQVQNGEALNISGLTGNLGAVAIAGAGTSLSVSGTNYVVNQGLTAAAGQSLTLGGTWSDAAGVAITATGATLILDGTWSNAAGSTITATGSTLNLGSSGNAWSNAGNHHGHQQHGQPGRQLYPGGAGLVHPLRGDRQPHRDPEQHRHDPGLHRRHGLVEPGGRHRSPAVR